VLCLLCSALSLTGALGGEALEFDRLGEELCRDSLGGEPWRDSRGSTLYSTTGT
jgi:hypothetical protein